MKFRDFTTKKKIAFLLVIIIPSLIVLSVCGVFLGGYLFSLETVDHLIVSKLPSKTIYYVGEVEDFVGLEIQIVKRNGSSFYITDAECTFKGFDSSVPKEELEIIAYYKEYSTTFFVQVLEAPKVDPILKSIEVTTLPKTEYKIGESLNTDGGVITRYYDDGSIKTLNLMNKYIYGFDSSTIGTYSLEVRIIEKGILASTTYEITVSE